MSNCRLSLQPKYFCVYLLLICVNFDEIISQSIVIDEWKYQIFPVVKKYFEAREFCRNISGGQVVIIKKNAIAVTLGKWFESMPALSTSGN